MKERINSYDYISGKTSFLWTDIILSVLIYSELVLILIFGIIDVPGGISQLIDKTNEQFSREDIHISPHSYGSMIIGQFVIWLFIFSAYYCSGMDKNKKRLVQSARICLD